MDAMTQVRDLFDKFKKAYPNSIEEFEPTLENIRRWQFGVHESDIRATKEIVPFNMPDSRRATVLAQSRAVGSFDRLPGMAKEKFLHLASLFPGRTVYATGSRITGQYIDLDSPGNVKKMRTELMKKDVPVSDYDITLDFQPGEKVVELRKLLPDWGDLIIDIQKGDPKIKIPMWDFTKLPAELFNEVIDLVESQQWGKLMSIHNDYQLSETFFCCDDKPAQRWFTWAVENKIIQRIAPVKTSKKRPTPPPPNVEPG